MAHATALCFCCNRWHGIHASPYLRMDTGDNLSPPRKLPAHMTEVAPGRWLCEMCSAWVCLRCGGLEQKLHYPAPNHYLKQYNHQYSCSPHPSGATGWYFGQDKLGLDVAQHLGAPQCLTCQAENWNRSAFCSCCGEHHSVTKNGVKMVDYIGTGSHMTLFQGKWYCEFCITAMCSRCGEAIIEPQSASKDCWAQHLAHSGLENAITRPQHSRASIITYRGRTW